MLGIALNIFVASVFGEGGEPPSEFSLDFSNSANSMYWGSVI